MPTYDYQGRDAAGKLIKGKRLSQSPETLSALLFKEGVTPIRIVEVKVNTDLFDQLKGLIWRGRVSSEEMSLFARQMHALLKTGVPITAALRQLAENTRAPQMANALYGIVEGLESGQELVLAMQKYPKIFSPIMLSMVRVGMESGQLDDAFLRLNQYLELEASGVKRVRQTFRYPAVILTTVFIALIFINLLIIPTFARVFKQANLQLPWITQYLIYFSEFLLNHWILNLFFLAGLIGLLTWYFKTPKGKYNWHVYQLKIPGMGQILRRVILLRFCQAFAITLNSGIPLLEGLTLVARTINNPYAEKEILNMCESIRHGKNLTQSTAETTLFTSLELQMLAVSEETGQISTMLEEVANYYRREIDYDIKKLNDIVEPTLIIILAIIVLFLAFSVYLPIWDMVKMART